jgi:hypothetical protein
VGLLVLAGLYGCHRSGSDPAPCSTETAVLDTLETRAAGPRELLHAVDETVTQLRTTCNALREALTGPGIARQLARARFADDRPEIALAELSAIGHPAVALRRAELLDRLGRPHDARAALAPALLVDDDAQAQWRLLSVASAARSNDTARVASEIAAAPLPDRPRLAHRAVADASEAQLPALAMAADVELVQAAGDRLEQLRGPAAARPARERAVSLDAANADRWDALARARIADGAIDDALAAWDRAAAIAPAQPSFRIAPIQALGIAGAPDRAKTRALALAQAARTRGDVDLLVTASAGAAAAADPALALALARDARARRPADGRLAFLLAQRLAEAGDVAGAAAAYADLLVCGAHGRAWHRHEVAARLQALDAATVRTELARGRACTAVEPTDLDTYLAGLRTRNP